MKSNWFVRIVLLVAFSLIFLFHIFPLFFGLGISFFDYNPIRTQNDWIGLENYQRMVQDPVFWIAVKNTLVFAAVTTICNLILSLFLAQAICSLPRRWMKTLVRTCIFIPWIAPMVGSSLIWKSGFLQRDGGFFNRILESMGQAPVAWLHEPGWLLTAIIIFTLWSDLGGNVILFSAALDNIPREFEESAQIDGAGFFRRLFLIRLPLMGRTFSFMLVMTTLGYFQIFGPYNIMAPTGGKDYGATVLSLYIYRQAFSDFNMGYASTIAMALFLIVLLVSLVQNRLSSVDWSYE